MVKQCSLGVSNVQKTRRFRRETCDDFALDCAFKLNKLSLISMFLTLGLLQHVVSLQAKHSRLKCESYAGSSCIPANFSDAFLERRSNGFKFGLTVLQSKDQRHKQGHTNSQQKLNHREKFGNCELISSRAASRKKERDTVQESSWPVA